MYGNYYDKHIAFIYIKTLKKSCKYICNFFI